MTDTDHAAFGREWTRFASWLLAHSSCDHAALRGPAGREGLDELESRLGFPLHPELTALLELHDGTTDAGAVPAPRAVRPAGSFLPLQHRLCGVADIATMYEVLVEVGEDFVHTESPDDDEDSDDDEDLAARLHLCVPFALPDDGGFALVDHRPGPTYGHVYELGIGSGDLDGTLWATSLTALFRALSDAVETGTPFLHYWPTTTKDESGRAHLAWQIRS